MSNIIALQRRKSRIRNKATLNAQTQKTIKSLVITLTSMIVILSGVFLLTTSQNGLKGNQLTQQKLLNHELKTQSKELTQKITISASIRNQQEKPTVRKMESTKALTYITSDDNRIN